MWPFCEILAKYHIIIKYQKQYLEIYFFKYQIYQVPWNSVDFFSGKLEVTWNSKEFHGTRKYGKRFMEFHGTFDLDKIPWNSVELEVLLLKFHGMP